MISPRATRRGVITGAGALALAAVTPRASSATPDSMRAAIRAAIGDVAVKTGRVNFEVPPLIENGNTVACAVTVESPMTATDHVKAIHVFNEKNPQPNVISAYFGPRAGRAALATRIRVADTQTLVAIAEMSDGSFWQATADVVVTLGACLEDI